MVIRELGPVDFTETYIRQKVFTDLRNPYSEDEIWCLEHHPVYTLGLAGKKEHLLRRNRIPVCHTDRGGQVTYHGPGQLVVYLLLDLKRKGIPVRRFVFLLEEAIIRMLGSLGIEAGRKTGAPGVYVQESKIAALGIRIRNGCCYHGLALNVDMDLSPFRAINPCGFPGLTVTRMKDLGLDMDVMETARTLVPFLAEELGYGHYRFDQRDLSADNSDEIKDASPV
jgi:lipoyl(octanoyl) transferase